MKIERRTFSIEEKEQILKITACKCGHCGKKLNINTMTVEHMYPLDKGGTHDKYNLIALCERCNQIKSNFVHDIYWYPYIKYNSDTDKYAISLYKNMFSNNSDKNIFGSANISAIAIDPEIGRKIEHNKKIKDKEKLYRMFGVSLELRPMYPGDIDDSVIKLFSTILQHYDCKINWEEDEISKLKLIDMQRQCTFYGVYNKDSICGISIYINIDKLENVPDSFTEELHSRGFNKAFLNIVTLFKSKYEYVARILFEIEIKYMAITNNLIMRAADPETFMHNNNIDDCTYYAVNVPGDYYPTITKTKESIPALLVFDDAFYNNRMDSVNALKEDLSKYDEV